MIFKYPEVSDKGASQLLNLIQSVGVQLEKCKV